MTLLIVNHHFISGICDDVMSSPNDVPIKASSNNDNVENLKDEDSDVWESNPEEDSSTNPTITITVSDADSFIDDVEVTGTSNIESITVNVIDQNGNKVLV